MRSDRKSSRAETLLLSALFLCTGMPALIYQIVWQRVLFLIYGVNSQSVAVVVSAFMLGLGPGSLLGGRCPRDSRAMERFSLRAPNWALLYERIIFRHKAESKKPFANVT